MKYALFAAAAAMTFATIAGSAGAQSYHERPNPDQFSCATHRDRCADARYIQQDRRDVYRDDRAIALRQEQIRAEERRIELDRLNRQAAIRNDRGNVRVSGSYGQRVANSEYGYIFGGRW